MSTIHFYGHVHPTNIPVSINELTTHVEHPQEGKATFTIRIQDSTVHVTCIDHDSSYTSQRGQILFFRAMHLTQAAVDLAGFVSGAGFQIIFEEAASFGVRPPTLRATSSSEFAAAAMRPRYSVLDTKKFACVFDVLARPLRESVVECLEAISIQGTGQLPPSI